MAAPTVVIVTFCASPVLSYGTLLTFKTLRVGFPTARVVVIDNGSHKDVLPDIEQAALAAGCEFRPMERIWYGDVLRWLLLEQEEFSPLVLVDPDVIFWQSVENWNFDGYLMAGRLLPFMRLGDSIYTPRLHPSHLWIPSPDDLRATISKAKHRFSGYDPIGSFGMDKFIFESLSPLYLQLKDKCRRFTNDELDHFDHLFYGCHLPIIPWGTNDALMGAHKQAAQGDLSALRGLWRKQNQELFLNFANKGNRERIKSIDNRFNPNRIYSTLTGSTTVNSDALVSCLSDLAQAIKLNSSTQTKRRNELVFDDRMGLLSLLTLAQCHN
ncbi:hypothetical protein [Propionivibrio sp.]|uniref:hypothetical protein n=1 Tax=Propionivibrio sp. TaxID=2212460 RepID=UPI00272E734C|nr:hypothetical protein [Propionivibrio sp.]